MDAEPDNPFSIFHDREGSTKRSLIASSKLLLFACVALLVSSWAYQSWKTRRIQQLTEQLPSMPIDQRIKALGQLANFDSAGLKGLIPSLGDQSPRVAEAARDLIDDMQRRWMTESAPKRDEHHLCLAKELARLVNSGRIEKPTHVLQLAEQVARSMAGRTTPVARESLALAVSLLGTQPTSVPHQSAVTSGRVTNQDVPVAKPLPLGLAQSQWTDWPPAPSAEPSQAPSLDSPNAGPRPRAPQLLRSPVASLPDVKPQTVILRQASRHTLSNTASPIDASHSDTSPTDAGTSAPQVIQPIVHQSTGIEILNLDQAKSLLLSRSRLVRLKAIHWLAESIQNADSPATSTKARQALLNHLDNEADLTAQYRVRQALKIGQIQPES